MHSNLVIEMESDTSRYQIVLRILDERFMNFSSEESMRW